jgi:hypothetical protein
MGNLPKRTIILRRLKGSDDAPTTWSGTNSPASRRYGAAMPPMALSQYMCS